ncbi:nitrogenase iron-molybdenum cofactor biosynthesis protein NifN [Magnetofaba australis]|uniref:Nitrogenase iron-molybdenum cofactor biosynthesis protein NifN n=1 Tax=Magnetofaba australis IT-1 TaxID=1434232 RepID=A0A1Y2K3V3_9PROT|nr:nitrogenase iron-molybdenum cofactor biosynthesis protein NifN [Magnetofaba australis]OSM04020.1 putative nitrogenase molybdenum-iron cofactor biosynthesis protein NifN [Magnetofaba australis IT-1]
MAEMIKRNKALAVRPAKSSQPVGGSLATLGLSKAIPMLHGSQGCTAFAKVFFVRHFREPIPLQTTAMDQVSTVMGADENIHEGLGVLAKAGKARLITLLSTGLSECQGADIHRVVKDFREQNPDLAHCRVVAVNTADFKGSLETGYAHVLGACVRDLVPNAADASAPKTRRVILMPSAHMTPADVEVLKEMVEDFGLEPVAIPDLSVSLDGHLGDAKFNPVSEDGATIEDFETAHQALGLISFGETQDYSANLMVEKTGLPHTRLSGHMGMKATDELLMALHKLSGQPVPAKYDRQRRQLQDCMLDTHFFLTHRRVAIASDPDHLIAWKGLLDEVGANVTAAVTSTGSLGLKESSYAQVKIGDLEDLEDLVNKHGADLLIGNTHVADLAAEMGLAALRCGMPVYDWIGAQTKSWIGYRGARDALFELANQLMHREMHNVAPYRSVYNAEADNQETTPHGHPLQTAARH